MNDFRKVNSHSIGLLILCIPSIAFAATASSGISSGIEVASEPLLNTYASSTNRNSREHSTSDPNTSVSSISDITKKAMTTRFTADSTAVFIATTTTELKTLPAPKPQSITGIALINTDFRFTLVWNPVVLPNKTGNSTRMIYRVSARVRNSYTGEIKLHSFNATFAPSLSIDRNFPGKEGSTVFTVEALIDEIVIGRETKKYRSFDTYGVRTNFSPPSVNLSNECGNITARFLPQVTLRRSMNPKYTVKFLYAGSEKPFKEIDEEPENPAAAFVINFESHKKANICIVAYFEMHYGSDIKSNETETICAHPGCSSYTAANSSLESDIPHESDLPNYNVLVAVSLVVAIVVVMVFICFLKRRMWRYLRKKESNLPEATRQVIDVTSTERYREKVELQDEKIQPLYEASTSVVMNDEVESLLIMASNLKAQPSRNNAGENISKSYDDISTPSIPAQSKTRVLSYDSAFCDGGCLDDPLNSEAVGQFEEFAFFDGEVGDGGYVRLPGESTVRS